MSHKFFCLFKPEVLIVYLSSASVPVKPNLYQFLMANQHQLYDFFPLPNSFSPFSPQHPLFTSTSRLVVDRLSLAGLTNSPNITDHFSLNKWVLTLHSWTEQVLLTLKSHNHYLTKRFVKLIPQMESESILTGSNLVK